MTTATTDDLVTLRERRRQLGDRLEDIRSEQRDIVEDLSAARTDWADCIEVGENADLLAERVHLRERELADRGHAAEHLGTLLADLDAKIADVLAWQQLDNDVASYGAALAAYTDRLPDLPSLLPDTVAVISDALDALISEVAAAKASHAQLAATAGSLRLRAGQLGTDVDAEEPPSWSAVLERAHDRDSDCWQLMLSVIQARGLQSVAAEIIRLIMLGDAAKRRRALR